MTTTGAPQKEWTLLFYNAGSRDQSKMCGWSQTDLESVGSNDKVDLVCLSERSGWIGDRWGKARDQQGTRLYHLQRNPEATSPHSGLGKLWQFLRSSPRRFFSQADPTFPKQTHLSDPSVLKASLQDAMRRYPAKHYGLVISGHGAGFGGQAVMHAHGDQPVRRLQNHDLGRVLSEVAHESGSKLDLINLNTCMGAGLESMAPLAQGAVAAVASEGVVFCATQPFGKVVERLQKDLQQGHTVEGPELARMFVEEAARQPLANLFSGTLSAVDLTRLDPLTQSLGELHRSLIAEGVDRQVVVEALKASARVDYSHQERPIFLTDLGSLAEQLASRLPQSSPSRLACNQVREALDGCILAEEHQQPARENLLSRLIRLPLGKHLSDPRDVLEMSGLTLYYDEQPDGPNNRCSQVISTDLGRQLGMEEFFTYLNGDEKLTIPSK